MSLARGAATLIALAVVGCGGQSSGANGAEAVEAASSGTAGSSGTVDPGTNDGSAPISGGRCGATDAAPSPPDSSAGAPSNDARCPGQWTEVAPAPAQCSVNGLVCVYPEGQAECAPDGPTRLVWWTNGNLLGCGESPPQIGAPCSMPGSVCSYIDGPPGLVSNFAASYCCDGTRCVWERTPDNGCPNGNTCGSITTAAYDQSCNTDSDCVVEPEGDFCQPNVCTNCAGAPLSVHAQAQYEADLASRITVQSICPCPLGPAPVCNQGKCGTTYMH